MPTTNPLSTFPFNTLLHKIIIAIEKPISIKPVITIIIVNNVLAFDNKVSVVKTSFFIKLKIILCPTIKISTIINYTSNNVYNIC